MTVQVVETRTSATGSRCCDDQAIERVTPRQRTVRSVSCDLRVDREHASGYRVMSCSQTRERITIVRSRDNQTPRTTTEATYMRIPDRTTQSEPSGPSRVTPLAMPASRVAEPARPNPISRMLAACASRLGGGRGPAALVTVRMSRPTLTSCEEMSRQSLTALTSDLARAAGLKREPLLVLERATALRSRVPASELEVHVVAALRYLDQMFSTVRPYAEAYTDLARQQVERDGHHYVSFVPTALSATQAAIDAGLSDPQAQQLAASVIAHGNDVLAKAADPRLIAVPEPRAPGEPGNYERSVMAAARASLVPGKPPIACLTEARKVVGAAGLAYHGPILVADDHPVLAPFFREVLEGVCARAVDARSSALRDVLSWQEVCSDLAKPYATATFGPELEALRQRARDAAAECLRAINIAPYDDAIARGDDGIHEALSVIAFDRGLAKHDPVRRRLAQAYSELFVRSTLQRREASSLDLDDLWRKLNDTGAAWSSAEVASVVNRVAAHQLGLIDAATENLITNATQYQTRDDAVAAAREAARLSHLYYEVGAVPRPEISQIAASAAQASNAFRSAQVAAEVEARSASAWSTAYADWGVRTQYVPRVGDVFRGRTVVAVEYDKGGGINPGWRVRFA